MSTLTNSETVAIIVSFERTKLLDECLNAIETQTLPPAETIVVDNSISEDPVRMISAKHPTVRVIREGKNDGGAGGFSRGVAAALKTKHSYMWLMDDDAEPEPHALETLLGVFSGSPSLGFVSPSVISLDGKLDAACFGFGPTLDDGPRITEADLPRPIPFGMFVGPLVNIEVARSTFLPVADFFIWWDDTEYLSRIQKIAGGMACPAARILHKRPLAARKLGNKFFYSLRNRIWIMKTSTLGSERSKEWARSTFWRHFRKEYRANHFSPIFVIKSLKYFLEGLTTTPGQIR
ncbi:glycosyltransferase [Brachybacterium sp. FME24]|uniref:glycosyltransferase n=1 Tax=Brachybacterium sp. FME24 TaxID=2742605 RepID=UPI001866501D|nr:glycosyltransferase [Brachybacterium sp. FME24]